VQSYVTCCVTLAIEKIMVCHRLWMIFGDFTHLFTVSIRNNITIIYFMVPLCSCITSLGSEKPLLFYLWYSFAPIKRKKKKTKRKGTISFYPPQKVGRQMYCVFYVFLVVSCKVAPLNCSIY
jgi:hypothetical protein